MSISEPRKDGLTRKGGKAFGSPNVRKDDERERERERENTKLCERSKNQTKFGS